MDFELLTMKVLLRMMCMFWEMSEIDFTSKKRFPMGLNGLQWNTLDMEFKGDLCSWLASQGSSKRRKMEFPNMQDLCHNILE